jgi:hypothetical protein
MKVCPQSMMRGTGGRQSRGFCACVFGSVVGKDSEERKEYRNNEATKTSWRYYMMRENDRKGKERKGRGKGKEFANFANS